MTSRDDWDDAELLSGEFIGIGALEYILYRFTGKVYKETSDEQTHMLCHLSGDLETQPNKRCALTIVWL